MRIYTRLVLVDINRTSIKTIAVIYDFAQLIFRKLSLIFRRLALLHNSALRERRYVRDILFADGCGETRIFLPQTLSHPHKIHIPEVFRFHFSPKAGVSLCSYGENVSERKCYK